MNKITELKQEAGLYSDTSGRWANADAIDKFAELIVRECSTLAFDGPNGILEHFGLGVQESKGWVCPKCGTDRTKSQCPQGHTAAVTGHCPMTAEAQ